MNSFIEFNGNTIEYNLTRKNVKNINMRVKPNRTVFVSAGYGVPVSQIEKALYENADKILKAFDRLEKISNGALTLENGSTVLLLGREYMLEIERAKVNSYSVSGKTLFLRLKNPDDTELIKRVFLTLLNDISKRVFPEILKEEYPKFQKYCPNVPELKIRNMKSQWGNCRAQRNVITLNCRLTQYDKEVIRFVVLHEYCHFIVQNHSASFYKELATVMPEWKKYDTILKNQLNRF